MTLCQRHPYHEGMTGLLPSSAPVAARTRRRPQDAEREILDAAERLLRQASVADLSVASVMARTGLGRSSFYVYFNDVTELLRRLTERLEGEFFEVSSVWLADDSGLDTLDAARRSTEGIVDVYVRHGPVLRALADAAATRPEVADIFRYGVIDHFIDAVERRCAQQHARGHIPHPIPRGVCRALVLMTERFLAETLGGHESEDVRTTADTLHTIWARVLYGREALPLPVDG